VGVNDGYVNISRDFSRQGRCIRALGHRGRETVDLLRQFRIRKLPRNQALLISLAVHFFVSR
jgi:hypothetical protein